MLKPINTLYKLYYSIFYFNSVIAYIIYKFRQLSKKILSIIKFSNEDARVIYAPHGSFIIFSKYFFQKGGYLDNNLTMYGEELTTAEITRRLNLSVHYHPDLEVIHVDHSSNEINWFKSFVATKKAYYYFLKEYL